MAGGDVEITLLEAGDRLGGKIRTTPFAGLPAVDEGARRVPGPRAGGGRAGAERWAAPTWCRRRADGPTCGGTARSTRSPTAWCSGCPPVSPSWPAPTCCRSAAGPGRRWSRSSPVVIPNPTTSARSSAIASAPRCSTASSIRWSAASTPATRTTSAWRPRRRRSRRAWPAPAASCWACAASAGLPRPTSPPASRCSSPREAGMQSLVDALTAALGDVRVLLGQPVEALEPAGRGRWLVNGVTADAVLLALPAPAAARLLARLSPDAEAILAGIGYASVAMVSLALPESGVRRALDGSGHLVPKPVQRHVTAASWASTKWAHWHRDGQVCPASIGRPLGRRARVGARRRPARRGRAAGPGHPARAHGRARRPSASAAGPSRSPSTRPGTWTAWTSWTGCLALDAAVRWRGRRRGPGLGLPACIRQGTAWADLTMRRLGTSATMG